MRFGELSLRPKNLFFLGEKRRVFNTNPSNNPSGEPKKTNDEVSRAELLASQINTIPEMIRNNEIIQDIDEYNVKARMMIILKGEGIQYEPEFLHLFLAALQKKSEGFEEFAKQHGVQDIFQWGRKDPNDATKYDMIQWQASNDFNQGLKAEWVTFSEIVRNITSPIDGNYPADYQEKILQKYGVTDANKIIETTGLLDAKEMESAIPVLSNIVKEKWPVVISKYQEIIKGDPTMRALENTNHDQLLSQLGLSYLSEEKSVVVMHLQQWDIKKAGERKNRITQEEEKNGGSVGQIEKYAYGLLDMAQYGSTTEKAAAIGILATLALGVFGKGPMGGPKIQKLLQAGLGVAAIEVGGKSINGVSPLTQLGVWDAFKEGNSTFRADFLEKHFPHEGILKDGRYEILVGHMDTVPMQEIIGFKKEIQHYTGDATTRCALYSQALKKYPHLKKAIGNFNEINVGSEEQKTLLVAEIIDSLFYDIAETMSPNRMMMTPEGKQQEGLRIAQEDKTGFPKKKFGEMLDILYGNSFAQANLKPIQWLTKTFGDGANAVIEKVAQITGNNMDESEALIKRLYNKGEKVAAGFLNLTKNGWELVSTETGREKIWTKPIPLPNGKEVSLKITWDKVGEPVLSVAGKIGETGLNIMKGPAVWMWAGAEKFAEIAPAWVEKYWVYGPLEGIQYLYNENWNAETDPRVFDADEVQNIHNLPSHLFSERKFGQWGDEVAQAMNSTEIVTFEEKVDGNSEIGKLITEKEEANFKFETLHVLNRSKENLIQTIEEKIEELKNLATREKSVRQEKMPVGTVFVDHARAKDRQQKVLDNINRKRKKLTKEIAFLKETQEEIKGKDGNSEIGKLVLSYQLDTQAKSNAITAAQDLFRPQIERIEAEIARLGGEETNAKNELTTADAKVDTLTRQLKQYENSITALENAQISDEAKEQMRKLAEQQKKQEKILEEKLNGVETDENGKKIKKGGKIKAEKKWKIAEAAHKTAESKRNNLSDTLKSINDSIRTQEESIQKQIDTLLENRKEIKARMDAETDPQKKLNIINNEWKPNHEQVAKKISEKNNIKANYAQRITDLNQQITQAQNEVNKAKKELDTKTNIKNRTEQEWKSAKTALENTQKAIVNLAVDAGNISTEAQEAAQEAMQELSNVNIDLNNAQQKQAEAQKNLSEITLKIQEEKNNLRNIEGESRGMKFEKISTREAMFHWDEKSQSHFIVGATDMEITPEMEKQFSAARFEMRIGEMNEWRKQAQDNAAKTIQKLIDNREINETDVPTDWKNTEKYTFSPFMYRENGQPKYGVALRLPTPNQLKEEQKKAKEYPAVGVVEKLIKLSPFSALNTEEEKKGFAWTFAREVENFWESEVTLVKSGNNILVDKKKIPDEVAKNLFNLFTSTDLEITVSRGKILSQAGTSYSNFADFIPNRIFGFDISLPFNFEYSASERAEDMSSSLAYKYEKIREGILNVQQHPEIFEKALEAEFDKRLFTNEPLNG